MDPRRLKESEVEKKSEVAEGWNSVLVSCKVAKTDRGGMRVQRTQGCQITKHRDPCLLRIPIAEASCHLTVDTK